VNSRHHSRRSFPFRRCDEMLFTNRNSRLFFSCTSAVFHFPYPATPLFAILRKTAGCISTIPILEPKAHAPILYTLFPVFAVDLMSFPFIPWCTPLYFFALTQDSTLLFSSDSALCAKITRGPVPPQLLPKQHYETQAVRFGFVPNLAHSPLPRATTDQPVTSHFPPGCRTPLRMLRFGVPWPLLILN